jgi:hypothetical protein
VKRAYLLGIILVLSGCAEYRTSGPPALPPYIHKLAIRPFTNHTQQFGLEDKLTLAVQSEFNRDGRYQISTEDQADGVVIGDITKYVLNAMSYDANHVPTEYKLSIEVAVSFTDKVKAATLWTEPAMEGELRYYVASSGLAGSMTEEDARQVINDELSRDIRTRTLEAQGGKKESGTVSTSTGTVQEPPTTIDNNPPPMPSEKPSDPSPTRLPY